MPSILSRVRSAIHSLLKFSQSCTGQLQNFCGADATVVLAAQALSNHKTRVPCQDFVLFAVVAFPALERHFHAHMNQDISSLCHELALS